MQYDNAIHELRIFRHICKLTRQNLQLISTKISQIATNFWLLQGSKAFLRKPYHVVLSCTNTCNNKTRYRHFQKGEVLID